MHAGATTDTLQLTGAPTSWSGHQYRCRVTLPTGTITGETYTLRFALNWSGAVGAAWEDPANWSCSTAIPDAYTDVYVDTGAPHYPLITSMAGCRTLRLHPGAIVVVHTGYELKVEEE